MTRLPLTLLYVPGDRPDRVRKAVASTADVVIVDLEDAVVGAAKDRARATMADLVAELATGPSRRHLQVRVNHPASTWGQADLEMMRGLPTTVGVRLPKCETSESVRAVADAVGDRALHLLLESALGVERAFVLATCHSRVASVGLGEADLRADLGVSGEEGVLWSRGRLVSASVAAGLGPPAMSVFTDVGDLAALTASCHRGRELGFRGRAAIHPSQLAPIHAAFTPTTDEVARAREVLAAAAAGERSGAGAVALPDGR
ncbi:MAG: CoA ester lyase, partial [Lapillicoccus sp.]